MIYQWPADINEVIVKNKQLVKGIINKRFHKYCPNEELFKDLFNRGCLALARAYATFDESRGTKFETLACTCIISECGRYIQEYFSKKNVFNRLCKPLPTIKIRTGLQIIQRDNLIDKNTEFPYNQFEFSPEEMADAFRKSLSQKEIQIVRAFYYENKSYKEIAQELNLSVPNVGHIKKQALERLKKYISQSAIA